MSSAVANLTSADIPVEQEGTVTSLRRMPRSTSTRLVLNRKLTVVVPKGVSHYFAGMRVVVRGVWKQGARHRDVLASAIEPVDTPADWSVERLSRALLGPAAPTGEQTAVLTVLAPVLTWLLTAGLWRLAAKRVQDRWVRLDGRETVEVSARDLELAYCLTVQKAQGSRYDTVVLVVPPVAKEFAEDVHRQYVGLTRGRRATVCYAL